MHFSTVPEVCWQMISSFATPPDVYNLCLSSKHFFGTTISVDDAKPAAKKKSKSGKKSQKNSKKKKNASVRASSGDKSPSPFMATRLLRSSLLSSLGRVLENSKTGITLESALALSDLPEGSALIAGSTMVQACLGVQWEDKYQRPLDVDIYCSAKAAPQVRSWMVDVGKLMFVGFKDTYLSDMTDRRVLYAVDTQIHHVEHWGSIIENIEKRGKGQIDPSALKETEYYKRTTEYGKSCQKNYV